MKSSQKQILEKIRQSSSYKDYEEAFQVGLEMPLTIRPVETWGLPLQGCKGENRFCAMIAGDRKTCTACLDAQQELASHVNGGSDPVTITCFAGFSETVVPIRHGGSLIGFLQTGQVLVAPKERKTFETINRKLTEWGSAIDREKLMEAFNEAPVMAPERYDSKVTLLKHYAEHLETMVNQIVVQTETAEAPLIQRARKFIEDNFAEELNLKQVAKAVHTSTFYFCKIFKKATGITFTEYLTRIRIEKAREMLVNPHTRISEAAFAVGFQSLSQFNRAFKKILGESPTEWRRKLPRAMVA